MRYVAFMHLRSVQLLFAAGDSVPLSREAFHQLTTIEVCPPNRIPALHVTQARECEEESAAERVEQLYHLALFSANVSRRLREHKASA